MHYGLQAQASTQPVVSPDQVALRPEAVPRWAEALALVEHAVAGLALEGVPQHVAAEAQQRADDAYRSGSARLPSAIELSVSLQAEPSAPLALRAARAFVGPPAELAADATAAARLLASCKPVATLWTPTGPPGAATTAATGADAAWPEAARMRIPLQRVPLPPADAAMAALPPLRAPPPNPYFLQGAAADVPRPLMEAVVERRSGVRVLQLPGCAEGGFRSFVDGIACAAPPGEVLGGGRERGDAARRAARGARRAPLLGAAVLQLYSSIPAAAAASTTQRARGELWRLSVTQALAAEGALAARAGLRWELSFNPQGARLAISGRAGRLPRLLSSAVAALIDHDPRNATEAAWAATRRAALAGVPTASSGVLLAEAAATAAALRAATAAEVAEEATRFLASIETAQLLLAGPVGAKQAAALLDEVSARVGALLPPAEVSAGAQRSTARAQLQQGLREWEPLLYRPRWQPQPLAQNPCADPALGATLDQCSLIANA